VGVVVGEAEVGQPRRFRLRPVRPAGWWFDALLLAGFVAITVALAGARLLPLDAAVADAAARTPRPLYWAERALNLLGQGGSLLTPLALLLALALAFRVRSARPFLPVAAAFVVTFAVVGPLKIWTHRAAPSSHQPTRVLLFNQHLPRGEWALSYPSGHVVNSIVWYGTIALLLVALLRAHGRRPSPVLYPVVLGVPPAILLVTTTGVGFHWLTDSVAGLLLGWLLYRLLARVPWDGLPLPRLPGGWDRPAGLTPPD
jgi:membrane-associated phospholipid phosphatase